MGRGGAKKTNKKKDHNPFGDDDEDDEGDTAAIANPFGDDDGACVSGVCVCVCVFLVSFLVFLRAGRRQPHVCDVTPRFVAAALR